MAEMWPGITISNTRFINVTGSDGNFFDGPVTPAGLAIAWRTRDPWQANGLARTTT